MQFIKLASLSFVLKEVSDARFAYLQLPIPKPILNIYTGICKSLCYLNRKGSEIKLHYLHSRGNEIVL